MIKVVTAHGNHNFEADSFKIDTDGRLVLLRAPAVKGEDGQVVAVWAAWLGVFQVAALAAK